MRLYPALAVLLCGFVLSAFVLGCGGGGGGATNSLFPQLIDKPPTLTLVSPSSSPTTLDVGASTSTTIKVRADDPDTKNLHMVVTWDYGSVTPSDSTVTAGTEVPLVFTPPSFDKVCNVTISVNDGVYTAVQTVTINVSGNVTTSDQLMINGFMATPNTAAPGSAVTISPTVVNPSGGTLKYKWTSASGSLSTADGSTTVWTAPTSAGIYGIYLTASDGSTNVRSGCLVTVSGASGGLTGNYYQEYRVRDVPNLGPLAFTRVDPNVNFNWQALGPGNSLGPNAFGAIWTGYIRCDDPGTYVFRVHADDGARMWIMNDADQQVWVIPNNTADWSDHNQGAWLPATTVPVTLNGGKWYPIHLEFFQGGGNAFITLYWTVNGGTEQIVPQDVLRAN
jgi:hypothetical protein